MEVLAMTLMVILVRVMMFLTRITHGHHDNDDEEDEDNYENNANHCEADGIVEEKMTAMAGHGGRRWERRFWWSWLRCYDDEDDEDEEDKDEDEDEDEGVVLGVDICAGMQFLEVARAEGAKWTLNKNCQVLGFKV